MKRTIIPSGVKWRELKPDYKEGMKWRNVVVSADINFTALVALAFELHNTDSLSSFRFFDDDAEIEQFQRWDFYYPSVNHPYPEAWASKHYLAMLRQQAGMRIGGWTLEAADGGRRFLPVNAKTTTLADLGL